MPQLERVPTGHPTNKTPRSGTARFADTLRPNSKLNSLQANRLPTDTRCCITGIWGK